MLQQAEPEDQRWGANVGNGWGLSHGSQRLKAQEESGGFVQEPDGGLLRSGGDGGGGYRGGFVEPLSVSRGVNSSGFGADLTLFSPSDLFSPSPTHPLHQNSSSPFSWQSLLGGQASARWPPDSSLSEFATFGAEPRVEQAKSLNAYAVLGEESVRRGGDGGQNELRRLAHQSSAGDGEIRGGDAGRSGEVKEEWTNNVNSEKENWRKFGGEISLLHLI